MSTQPDFDLSGKRAVVTGGTSGIGRAISFALADAGADVIPTARTEGTVAEVVEAIRSRGSDSFMVTTDVTEPDQVNELFERVENEFGGLDVLVNNAAAAPDRSLGKPEEIDEASFELPLDVNLTGLFRCSRAGGEAMLASGGGSIVNVGSISGVVGVPGNIRT